MPRRLRGRVGCRGAVASTKVVGFDAKLVHFIESDENGSRRGPPFGSGTAPPPDCAARVAPSASVRQKVDVEGRGDREGEPVDD